MPEGTNNTQQSNGPDATTSTSGQDDVNRLLAAERRTQEQRFADAVTKLERIDLQA